MSDIDEKIRQALTTEDQEAMSQIDEQAGLFDMLGMTFSGKQAWMSYYMWAMGFASFFVGIYCLNRFFVTDDLKTSIAWVVAVIACMFILTIIKILSWQQIQKLELMREIKRLEMRIMLASENHQQK